MYDRVIYLKFIIPASDETLYKHKTTSEHDPDGLVSTSYNT